MWRELFRIFVATVLLECGVVCQRLGRKCHNRAFALFARTDRSVRASDARRVRPRVH
jgi:hypothetical protein